MGDDSLRQVQFERTANNKYEVRNVRGGSISVGSGSDTDFTPVELFLASIGVCSAIDVDTVTSRRAEPTEFRAVVRGDKLRDPEQGNRMEDLVVEFTIRFPEGEDGDKAREALPRALKMSHDRLCTVSRTVEIGTPVTARLVDETE
ncbi:putative OsmC-like protein [Kribbella orskensis]|uniref:OsmC-like protein n=1 Tax=Kribbella orskensis TaxID=2512216 RepID=A0ABY2BEX4_9ACTN|nr:MULTISPECIES: OsmC family protein [Kribbella]TCN36549.1 putative OsmC-like protein [Kribbella sp. VKM Ac-2500]TCO17788.1 putative OsmC-like protein [Kribbella orskensis]